MSQEVAGASRPMTIRETLDEVEPLLRGIEAKARQAGSRFLDATPPGPEGGLSGAKATEPGLLTRCSNLLVRCRNIDDLIDRVLENL